MNGLKENRDEQKNYRKEIQGQMEKAVCNADRR